MTRVCLYVVELCTNVFIPPYTVQSIPYRAWLNLKHVMLLIYATKGDRQHKAPTWSGGRPRVVLGFYNVRYRTELVKPRPSTSANRGTTNRRNHQKVQSREEPIWRVTLEQPTSTERRCQTCSLTPQRSVSGGS
ncbi:hypothetical protein J6590_020946 [Homalodisca vitripennis]|nr:hypothetical protein J6590_020946 [Homalodisca vitripennis]